MSICKKCEEFSHAECVASKDDEEFDVPETCSCWCRVDDVERHKPCDACDVFGVHDDMDPYDGSADGEPLRGGESEASLRQAEWRERP